MDKERGQTRERELSPWTERQGVISFVVLIILCLSFYTLGIFVGRWSSSNAVTTASSLPANSLSANTSANSSLRLGSSTPAANSKDTSQTAEKPFTEQKKDFLSSNSEKYSVQVASPTTQEEADHIVEKLRKIGLESVHIISPQPNSVAQFYAVRVGPYDVDTARQVAEELQRDHNFKNVQVMPRPAQ